MNKAYCLVFLFLISVCSVSHAQDINYSNVDSVIIQKGRSARNYWEYGRFEEAEKISKEILQLKLEYYSGNPSKVLNNYYNLASMYYYLARFDDSFEMYENVLAYYSENNNSKIADIINTMGTIFHLRMDYSKALQYYFNAIRIFEASPSPDKLQLSSSYTNIGIVYFTMGQFDKATEYFSIAFELAKGDIRYYESILGKHCENLLENNLPDVGKYLQLRSDLLSKIDSKINHIQFNIDYAEYAVKVLKEPDIAIEYLNNALQLSLVMHDIHKPNLHEIYFDLADIYFSQKKYLISLNFINQLFQYSFREFKSFNYTDNPVLSNGNFKIVIIDALTLKSKVLYNMYLESRKIEYLDAGVNTIQHSIDGINQVRLRINSEESKFLLSKKQLNTFKLAQEIIYEKYRLTNDIKYKDLSFEVIEMGRNFSLLSSLRSIKAIEYGDIPPELLKREGELNQKISFYNEKVLNEKGLDNPNENYIKVWETYIFDLTREYDDLIAYFEKEYKGYYNLKYDTKVISMDEVSAKLSEDDLVIEYSLMDTLLFTYMISQDETRIFKQKIDTSFSSKCLKFYEILTKQNFSYGVKETFNNYTQHGYDIYKVLLEPYEEYIKDKNLIFIPDGAISFVPFDALITEEVNNTEPNYYKLPYLIRKNAVSTSYSSTIHFNDLVNHKKTNGKVLAFAPDYANLTAHNPGYNFLRQDDRDKLIRIPGVQEEVTKISDLTSTKMMRDRDASETNFKNIAPEFGILHLAMHTILDDEDPLYSKLAFTQFVDSINDGFLYTYEIYNMKLNANLAVLSSCGSGFGNFREGEGIQSMARSFAYAGCPSILMTLWEVADLSTVSVMERFYYHLKRGKSKSKALQLSKLEFLDNADQLRSNPFFWSSYTIVGNSEPIFTYFPWGLILKIALLFLPVPIILLIIRSYRRQAQKNIF